MLAPNAVPVAEACYAMLRVAAYVVSSKELQGTRVMSLDR
jgi:hypothetical protein